MAYMLPIQQFAWTDSDMPNEQQQSIAHQLSQFALTEQLAHSDVFAYGAMSRHASEVIDLALPSKMTPVRYQVVKMLTHQSGLVGEILVPVHPSETQDIYINWTGTHNLSTLLADLETSAGEQSFQNDQQLILEQINAVIGLVAEQSGGKKVNLTVTGHSLGGAIAQLNFHALQQSVLATNTHNHLNADYINHMTIGTWNATGVSHIVQQSSNQLAKAVSQTGIKQRAFFGLVGGDGIQRTGEGNILSDVDENNAEVHLLKVDIGLSGQTRKVVFGIACGLIGAMGLMILGLPAAVVGGLAFSLLPVAVITARAHTSTHFDLENPRAIRGEIYQNNTPAGRLAIQTRLEAKNTLLNLPPVQWAKQGVHFALAQLSAHLPAIIVEPKDSVQTHLNRLSK